MEREKYFKQFGLLAVGTLLVYLIVTNQYGLALQSIRIPLIDSSDRARTDSTTIKWTNETNVSSGSVSTSGVKPFEVLLPDYYPRLPIHMYTHNATFTGNRSKLILLGNGFFGDRKWGLPALGTGDSTKLMTSLFCPYLSTRCDMTADMNRFAEADAVVYHMRDGVDRDYAMKHRRPEQRFVFNLWESPAHTPGLQAFRKFFNWTMTYRFTSDIITSYYSDGAYVHKSSEFYRLLSNDIAWKTMNASTRRCEHRPSNVTLAKKKLGLAAALISNCGGSSRRLAFIEELQRQADVHVYGRCGKACPPNTNCRKFIAENYYFILSFENSLCADYTTEKFFASLEFPIVPVVFGLTNYSHFIPSSGFIDARQYSTVLSLAKHLNQTRDDPQKYSAYFSWKQDYVWGLGHFFTPFCDLCLRLHLDAQPKIIDDIHSWWFNNTCKEAVLPK